MSPSLNPAEVARELLGISPDRDERASQLVTETLLTLYANVNVDAEVATQADLYSPKRGCFALRSLILGQNFLEGQDGILENSSKTVAEFGAQLAAGEDVDNATNLELARGALANLLDPETQRGSAPGDYLLRPLHGVLLWYDARKVGQARFTVRQVRMRGTGLTLARMLLDGQPADTSENEADSTVQKIVEALSHKSPVLELAEKLESQLPRVLRGFPDKMDNTEWDNWNRGTNRELTDLATSVRQHVDGIMSQEGVSNPVRLWQLRNILALDVAVHVVRRSWEKVTQPYEKRGILMAMPGRPRQQDSVRIRAERSYKDARDQIAWATIQTIQERLQGLGNLNSTSEAEWREVLPIRSYHRLMTRAVEPYQAGIVSDTQQLAQRFYESADYKRAGESFRVLFESIGMVAGGTRFSYLSPTPDALASFVGALSGEMPMTSDEFLCRLKDEWSLIASPEAAEGTPLSRDLGSELANNARKIERMLITAGLASGLSDRTVLVGERTKKAGL